jgi:hypothetical protein
MRTRIALVTLLVVSILLGVGCTTTEINPGTETSATYRLGALRAQLAADMEKSYQATEAAAQELGLSVVQRLKDKLESQITARDAQDRKIKISLLAVTGDTTEVTIHVGSSEKAARIYQTILKNLGGE